MPYLQALAAALLVLLGAAGSALATPISIDATALTTSQLAINGVGAYSTHSVQVVDLPPGSYTFIDTAWHGSSFSFSVTAAGSVAYAPALDTASGGFLSGAGTSTLTVLGFAVTVDASLLTTNFALVDQETGNLPHAPVTLHLIPGTYHFVDDAWHGTSFTFDVTGSGTVSYAPSLDAGAGGFLSGAGTSTLTVVGFAVIVDASMLTTDYALIDQETGNLPHVPVALRLLPGNYHFVDDAWHGTSFTFDVTATGTISYASSFDVGAGGFLGGTGTAGLVVLGFPVTVDPSVLTTNYAVIDQETGNLPHAATALRLIPGTYHFVDDAWHGSSFTFDVASDGTISYAPALDAADGGFLGGAGTTGLVVLGFPITVDPSALSTNYAVIDQETGNLPHAATALRLIPGTYHFVDDAWHGAAFMFDVTSTGTIAYAASLSSFLSGAGTSNLVVEGFQVTLCAEPLSSSQFGVNQESPLVPTGFLPLTLIPGLYQVIVDANQTSSTFDVTVAGDGSIAFDPTEAGFLQGNGAGALAIVGYAVTFTADPAVFGTSVGISGVPGCQPTGQPITLELVPGTYTISACNASARETFALAADPTSPATAGTVTATSGSGASFASVVPASLGTACRIGAPTCVSIQRGLSGAVADALIADNGGADGSTTTNFGSSQALTAGAVGSGQRQGLLRFDLSGIPPGARILSAQATLNVLLYGGAPVRAHQATAPWSESTVTWASFGEAYLGATVATFPSGSPTSADLTSIVQAWVRGSVQNDGLLLERDLTGATVFSSSEGPQSARPRLDVCYQ